MSLVAVALLLMMAMTVMKLLVTAVLFSAVAGPSRTLSVLLLVVSAVLLPVVAGLHLVILVLPQVLTDLHPVATTQ